MKLIIKSTLLVAFFAIVLTGCKKYEDGPAFSLRSKKARITGDWKIEKATDAGIDVTALYQAGISEWDIEKDGSYKLVGLAAQDGKWELGEDKDDIFFTANYAGATKESYRILRLKNKEMWLKQTQSNGDVIEVHLKQ